MRVLQRSPLDPGQGPNPGPATTRSRIRRPGLGYHRTPTSPRRRSHPGRRPHQSPPNRSNLDGNRSPTRPLTSRCATTLHTTSAHEPTKLDTGGLDNHPDSGVETEHGPHLGNYVIVTPGELRDRRHLSRTPARTAWGSGVSGSNTSPLIPNHSSAWAAAFISATSVSACSRASSRRTCSSTSYLSGTRWSDSVV